MQEHIYGQLGDGSDTDRESFVLVVSKRAKAVAAGGVHSMVLKLNGSVWATGYNLYGQLGDGSKGGRSIFLQVISGDAEAVAAGGYHNIV